MVPSPVLGECPYLSSMQNGPEKKAGRLEGLAHALKCAELVKPMCMLLVATQESWFYLIVPTFLGRSIGGLNNLNFKTLSPTTLAWSKRGLTIRLQSTRLSPLKLNPDVLVELPWEARVSNRAYLKPLVFRYP